MPTIALPAGTTDPTVAPAGYIPEVHGWGKANDVLAASQAKALSLRTAAKESILGAAAIEKRKALDLEQAKTNTVAGFLGVDPNSLGGTLLNAPATLGSAFSTLTGQVASAPATINTVLLNKDIPQEVKDARARQLAGKATPEDEHLLSLPRGDIKDRTPVAPDDFMHQVRKDFVSNLKQVTDMEQSIRNAQQAREFFDLSKGVNQGNKKDLVDTLKADAKSDLTQLSGGYDQVKAGNTVAGLKDMASGLAGAISKLPGAAAANPLGTADYLVENLPNMLAASTGPVGMATSNTLYGVDTFSQGVAEHVKDHGGAMPTNEDLAWKGGLAATAALAELYGDKLMGIPKMFKGANKAIETAITREVVKQSLLGKLVNNPLTNNPLTRTAGAVAEGGVGEFGTEGYQTWAENAAKGKDTTLEEAFVGAGIGSIIGGVTGGGTHILSGGHGSPKEDKPVAELPPEQAAAQDAAITTGDVSALLDPQHPAYDPVMAVAALVGNSKLDTTTEEQKQANVVKAGEIVTDLENTRDSVKALLATPEEKQAELVSLQTDMAAVDPTDTARIAKYESAIKNQEAEIAAPALTGEEIRGYQLQVSKIEGQIEEAKKSQFGLDLVVTPDAKIEEHIANINKPVDTTASPDALAADVARSATSAVSVINLAMASPDRLDPAVATQLADNTSNSLTEPQRGYLRAFSEARLAANQLMTMDKVSQEIQVGSPKGTVKPNKGIDQYRSALSTALMAGNKEAANKELVGLTKFMDDHVAKAQVAAEAIKRGLGTQMVNMSGQWQLATKTYTKAELSANGGLAVNSGKLVANIKTEATALKAAVAELQSAYDLKFNSTVQPTSSVNAGASNVTDTSRIAVQPGLVLQADTQGKTEQAPTEVGVSTAPASVGTTDAQPAAVVGASVGETGGVSPALSTTHSDEDVAKTIVASNPELAGLTANDLAQYGQVDSAKDGTVVMDLGGGNKLTIIRQFGKFSGPAHDTLPGTHPMSASHAPINILSAGADLVSWFETINQGKVDAGGKDYFKLGKSPIVVGTNAVETGGVVLKDGGRVSITTVPAPEAFGSIVQMEYGTPVSIIATNEKGEEVGKLTYMPNGGPIDSFVREQDRRRGIATVLYDAHKAAGGKLPSEASGVIISDAARSLRKSLKPTEKTASTEEPLGSSVKSQGTEGTQSTDTSNRSSNSASKDTSTKVDSTVEQTKTDTVEPSVVETVNAGALSVLAAKSPEGTHYQLKNLIAEHFTQQSGRKSDSTQRPLVAVKDFFSALKNDATLALTHLTEKKFSDAQQATLDSFIKHTTVWIGDITRNLPKLLTGNRLKFRHEDVMQYFLFEGKNGTDMDENLKTAIAHTVFDHVATDATAPRYLKDKSINALLGRSKDARVSALARDTLALVGTYQHNLIDSLGGSVLDVLGLRADENISQDVVAKVRVAFGTHALKLLEDKGLIKRTVVTAARMQQMREEGLDEQQLERLWAKQGIVKSEVEHYFFAIARDAQGELAPQVNRILQVTKGTQGILNKLFKTTSRKTIPSLVPVTTVQSTTAGTQQNVPDELKASLLIQQAYQRVARKDTLLLFDKFNEADVHAMLGVVPVNNATTHKVNRIGLTAKNEGLIREYIDYIEYIGEYLATAPQGLDTPMYLTFSAWQQQRVGIALTVGNPQTSKIVRHLMASPNWTFEVKLDDTQAMTDFYIFVGDGLGVKTERADNDVSVAAIKEMLTAPVYVQAIDALHKGLVQKETLSVQEQASVVAAVAKGGANIHTLDVLMGLAYHQEALTSKNRSFRVQMMGEVDGVANGTMLNHMLLGAKGTVAELQAFGNMGGFFELGNEHTQYNQWRGAEGHRDVYETTAYRVYLAIQEQLNQTTDPVVRGQVASIWAIAGNIFNVEKQTVTKDGRNLIKDGMNPLGFGSSLKSIVRGMSGTFLDAVYTGFEKLSKQSTPATQAEIDTYVGHINALIGNNKYSLPKGLPLAKYMETILHPMAEKAILDRYATTVGQTTADVLEQDFAVFLERRNALNTAAQQTFGLYDAVRRGMREAYIAELLAKGEIPLNDEGERIGDLTQAQEEVFDKSLSRIAPLIQTTMSKEDKNPNTGMLLAKTERKQNYDPAYQNRTQFGTLLSNGKQQHSISSRGQTQHTIEPGVKVGSAETHSTDSGAMQRLLAEVDANGIHDAVGDGLGSIRGTSILLNQKLWNTLVNYSPLEEVYQAMARVIVGIADIAERGELSPQATRYLKEYLGTQAYKLGHSQDLLGAMLGTAKHNAVTADTMKLKTMQTWATVDQYAKQGGNYLVTDKDRAHAAKLLAALSNDLAPVTTKALETLKEHLNAPAKRVTTKEVVTETSDTHDYVDGEDQANIPDVLDTLDVVKTSPFGEVNKSIKGDPDLIAFFNKNPKATAKQTIEYLFRKLSATPEAKNQAFNLKLLRVLSKTVNSNLTINHITAQTKGDDVLGFPEKPVMGWYSTKGVDEAIYIVGSDFKQSNITTELLLHELVHAAVAYRLTTTAGKAYRAELETLLKAAQQYVKEQELAWAEFNSALTSVDELVAYGMTSHKFQREVLAKVKMTGTTHKSMSTALKEFVGTLSRLLGFKDAKAAQGLGVLISNVTALMEQGANEKTDLQARNLAMSSPEETANNINAFSTLDIHDALRDATAPLAEAFDNHLRGLLGGIVEKLHGPFGAFKKTVADKIHFTTLINASPLPSSNQESFAASQVEATVRAVMSSAETTIKTAYKDLVALYTEMNQALNRDGRDFYTGDWSKATPNEKAIAKAERDFIFEINQDKEGKSDYLSRFAALGLANEKFNSILQRPTAFDTKRVADAKTWEDRLQTIFANILEFFHSRLMGTYKGQNADVKLAVLVGHLVAIETQEKSFLAKMADSNMMEPMEGMAKKFAEVVRAKVEGAASSDFVRDNKNLLVRTAGTAVRTVAGNRVEHMLEGMRQWRNENIAGQQGMVASLLQEYKGHNKVYLAMLRIRKLVEQNRQTKSSLIAQTAMSTFADEGKALLGRDKQSKALRNSITSVFLRTGAHNLLDHFSMAEIEHLVLDKANVDAAITDLKAQLQVFGPYAPFFIKQANVLGANKAFGGSRGEFLQQNAHVISRMLGTSQADKITTAQAKDAERLIKPLITLYALRYSGTQELVNAHKVLSTENARKGENGVEFVLQAHQRFEAESLERIFNNDPTQMIHGYTPEIYDPRVEVVNANAAEGAVLKAQGYDKVGTLYTDRADPNREAQQLYSLKDGGLTRRVSAIFAMQTQHARGTLVHSGYLNSRTVTGLVNAGINADILQDRAAAINSLFQPGMEPDLSNVKASYLVPDFNLNGEIVNWRYMMQESTKDTVLKRDNRFDKVLGTLAGSIFDKATIQERNLEPIQALKDQHDSEESSNPKGYMLVGQASTDPELKEIWNLLPSETQRDIRKIWGYNGMMVRTDTLDIMFGYRKLSIADMFRKDPKARHAWENLIVYFGEAMFGQKAALRVTQGERGWQEMVGEAKDIIVVKSGKTMLRNFRSNMWQLYTSGVPLADILTGHLTAWKAANAHHEMSSELHRLQMLQETGYTQGKDADIAHRILMLENDIARSPINKLIEGGLMPTIQEDLDPEDDQYSYKSALSRKVQDVTDGINPHIMSIAKYVYMAHDTPLYQGLRKATQLSDFMARYVMYQHLVNRKENPLDHKEALNDASAAFVNYDVPMHQLIQYSDDMGLTMFTKYFLRMQGVLSKMMQENPGRVLTSVAAAHYLGLGSTVLEDSSMWAKIGNNPFQAGAFKYFESIDELTTINSAMSIFQTGAAAPAIKAVGKVAGLPV